MFSVNIANNNDAVIGVPTISGTESKNSILSANVDNVTDADGINTSTKGYQWLRDENEISDATSSTYTLTGNDVGTKITVRYSFTDNHGANETVVSSSTGLINNTNFQQSDYEIISNVTAKPIKNPEDIKKLLVQQIYSKVRWRESILFMSDNKINDFIEIGPGKVLTGLVKRVLPNSNSFSVNSIDDIKNLNNESS